MKRLLAVLLGLASVAAPASARDDGHFRQVTAGEPITLRADRAYVLLRVKKSSHAGWISPGFLRVPAESEVSAFETLRRAAHVKAGKRGGPYEEFAFQHKDFGNLYGVNLGRNVAETETMRTVLLDVTPGTYVLVGGGMRRAMWTCFCLGSVQVTAAAGTLVDAGTFFGEMASKPSAEAELAAVTNRGAMAQMDFASMAGAIRPYRPSDPLPASLAGTTRVPADYRAVGPFVLREALLVNYLAPVPGVLEYRRGEVVDVKSGAIVPSR